MKFKVFFLILIEIHYVFQLIAVWGMYFDKTSRDEQIPGSRVPRIGRSCRSLVAGEQEQEYSAHPRIRHPRGRSPIRSIKPFLLKVEARRPSQ